MPITSAEHITNEVRQFIVENFLFGRSIQFSDDDSFIEQGLIDSTGVLELIACLEEKFSFKIWESEMVPDNLDSLHRVADFVRRKRPQG